MKGIKILALTAATFTVFTAASSSYACVSLPTAWYVEGNVGTSTESNRTYGANTTSSTSGLGWNGNFGYKFMPYFALDAGVISFANTNVKASSTSNTFAQDRHWSYNIAAKGILPLSDSGFEGFVKLGGTELYSSIKVTDGGTQSLTGFNGPYKNNSTSLFYGAGVNYFFSPTLGAVAQWNQAKGNSKTGVQNFYSVGLTLLVY